MLRRIFMSLLVFIVVPPFCLLGMPERSVSSVLAYSNPFQRVFQSVSGNGAAIGISGMIPVSAASDEVDGCIFVSLMCFCPDDNEMLTNRGFFAPKTGQGFSAANLENP